MITPEVSTGELLGLLDGLMLQSNSIILVETSASLSKAQAAIVMGDLGLARSQVQMMLQMKLLPLQHLPYALLGLAHYERHEAREAARRCLRLFASAGDSVRHDGITLRFLAGPHNVLRDQLEAFAGSFDDLSCFPELELATAELRFILTSERSIEGAHAATHRETTRARHHSCVHVGYHAMLPHLKRVLSRSASAITQLATSCAHCSTPLRACETLGLRDHPVVQAILQEHPSQKTANRLCGHYLAKVLWHCDSMTLFQKHEFIEDLIAAAHHEGSQVAVAAEPNIARRVLTNDALVDRLTASAAVAFLQARLPDADLKTLVFSIGHARRRDLQAHFVGLPDFFAQRSTRRGAVADPHHNVNEDPAVQFMPEETCVSAPLPGTRHQLQLSHARLQRIQPACSFFRICQQDPSKAHLVSGPRVPQGTLAVSSVAVFHVNAAQREMLVSTEGADAIASATFFLDMASMDTTMLKSLRAWEPVNKDLACYLNLDIDAERRVDCERAVAMLLEGNAGPAGTPFTLTHEYTSFLPALQYMEMAGLVACVHASAEPAHSKWIMTQASTLCFNTHLESQHEGNFLGKLKQPL